MIILWILIHLGSNSALAKRHHPADFESLSRDPYYVDKTEFIAGFFRVAEERKRQIITSAPGFMKSTNLDMIKRFVQIDVDDRGNPKEKNHTRNFLLFNDAKFSIKKYDEVYETHLAKHPVVHLELSGLIGPAIPDIFVRLSDKIRKCYSEYVWLYKLYQEKYPEGCDRENCTEEQSNFDFMRIVFQPGELKAADIQKSIYKLIEIAYNHFNSQVIVLIDDYDAPVIDTVVHKEHHIALNLVEYVLDQVVGNLFKPALDKYIKYLLVMGTNSVPLTIPDNRTDFNYFSSDHPFAYNFTITEDELVAKLDQVKNPTLFASIKAKFGGYRMKGRENAFCRPLVSKFFTAKRNTTADSWIDSGSLSALAMFLNNTQIRMKIEELIYVGKIIFQLVRPIGITHYQNLSKIIRGLMDVGDFDVNVFFTILLENGYLTYDTPVGNLGTEQSITDVPKGGEVLNFKIPNENVKESFEYFYSFFTK